MLRRIITSVPNFLTCCNLLSGCLACICSFSFEDTVMGSINGRQMAWILVGLAAVFDFFDGAAARILRAPSPLGKELDSLADLVSFGVAPSLLLYNILQVWTGSWWVPFVALFIPAMGALRLAKFNLDDSQTTEFKGLPIPANAIFWIGATAWMQSHGLEWMHEHVYWGNLICCVVIIGVALLMVSNMRMFSLKLKNFRIGDNFMRYLLLLGAAFFVAFSGVEGFAYTIIFYFVLSVINNRMTLAQTSETDK